MGSARCSIDEGGFGRAREGTNVFCLSSILDAQSTTVSSKLSEYTVFGLIDEV
jgi:hypothetical protein